eukprot:Rmarinus@m.19303
MDLFLSASDTSRACPLDCLVPQFGGAVEEHGLDAWARHASCETPALRSRWYSVLNPTGDLFTIRPVDLLRKLFDELSVLLRWVVADRLSSRRDEGLYLSALHGRRLTVVQLAASDHARVSKRTCPQEGPRHACPASSSLLSPACFCGNVDGRCPRRLVDPRIRQLEDDGLIKKGAVRFVCGLAAFFELGASSDVCKLLQHMESAAEFYAVLPSQKAETVRRAAGVLFKMRNLFAHRVYLSIESSCEEILLACWNFFGYVADIVPSGGSPYATYSGPIDLHFNQLMRMKALLKTLCTCVHANNSLWDDDARENQLAHIESQLCQWREETDENVLLTERVLVGSRFRVPGDTSRSVPPADVSYTSSTSPMRIERVVWDRATGKPQKSQFLVPDKLGVTHADLFHRAFDVLGIVLHHLLSIHLWRAASVPLRKKFFQRYCELDCEDVDCVRLPLPLNRKRTFTHSNFCQRTGPLTKDPCFLLQLLLRHFTSAISRLGLLEDMEALLQVRHQFLHQEFIRKGELLKLSFVFDHLARMERVCSRLHDHMGFPSDIVSAIQLLALLRHSRVSYALYSSRKYTLPSLSEHHTILDRLANDLRGARDRENGRDRGGRDSNGAAARTADAPENSGSMGGPGTCKTKGGLERNTNDDAERSARSDRNVETAESAGPCSVNDGWDSSISGCMRCGTFDRGNNDRTCCSAGAAGVGEAVPESHSFECSRANHCACVSNVSGGSSSPTPGSGAADRAGSAAKVRARANLHRVIILNALVAGGRNLETQNSRLQAETSHEGVSSLSAKKSSKGSEDERRRPGVISTGEDRTNGLAGGVGHSVGHDDENEGGPKPVNLSSAGLQTDEEEASLVRRLREIREEQKRKG